jgi:hypothetical protein
MSFNSGGNFNRSKYLNDSSLIYADHILVLARLSCVLNNPYVCDADNQSVDYKVHRREKCEACIIKSIYQVELEKFGLEYEMADNDAKAELEAQAMQEAKDVVSSPLRTESFKSLNDSITDEPLSWC